MEYLETNKLELERAGNELSLIIKCKVDEMEDNLKQANKMLKKILEDVKTSGYVPVNMS